MATRRERENDSRAFNRLISRAYIRDGHSVHTGEALLLACLLHAKGKGRDTDDMREVQRIMKDRNTN